MRTTISAPSPSQTFQYVGYLKIQFVSSFGVLLTKCFERTNLFVFFTALLINSASTKLLISQLKTHLHPVTTPRPSIRPKLMPVVGGGAINNRALHPQHLSIWSVISKVVTERNLKQHMSTISLYFVDRQWTKRVSAKWWWCLVVSIVFKLCVLSSIQCIYITSLHSPRTRHVHWRHAQVFGYSFRGGEEGLRAGYH